MAGVAAFINNFSLAELTPEERVFVRRTRLSQLLSSLNFNINAACALVSSHPSVCA
jgi:hypothetical protein